MRCSSRRRSASSVVYAASWTSPWRKRYSGVGRRLLEEQGIAARALGKQCRCGRRQLAARGRGGQPRALVLVERLELELTEEVPVAAAGRLAEAPRRQVRVIAVEQQDGDGL